VNQRYRILKKRDKNKYVVVRENTVKKVRRMGLLRTEAEENDCG